MSSVVFPDIAALCLGVVRARLDVPTGSHVPNPRPATFVLARRVGGERITPLHETALVYLECWAATPGDADDLANMVRAEIFRLAPVGTWAGGSVEGVPFYRVTDAAGTSFVPDELTDQPRSTFTLMVQVRGQLKEESHA